MRIAVVGATGQVGTVMRRMLVERAFPVDEIRFLASARSAGSRLPWGDGDVVVEDAATADLTGIDVPATAQWVLPGAEYNKGSYWRVYSSQVHYTVDGRAGSFTIASMISWRGEWYIVHLASIQ